MPKRDRAEYMRMYRARKRRGRVPDAAQLGVLSGCRLAPDAPERRACRAGAGTPRHGTGRRGRHHPPAPRHPHRARCPLAQRRATDRVRRAHHEHRRVHRAGVGRAAPVSSSARPARAVPRSPLSGFPPPPLPSVRHDAPRELAHRADQLGDFPPALDRLTSVGAMPPIGMPPPLRRSRRRSTMHPASPVAHRRRPAWRPSPSARSASGRRVHGVHPIGRGHPLPPPPLSTAPTIACPPAATFTCSTTTRCCEPFPRWRFNASISTALVRLSRFA